jgi:hypothetical protein
MSLDSCIHITDVGMAAFEDMRRLQSLDLSDTAVGDAGIAHLSKTVTLVGARSLAFWRGFCGRRSHLSPLVFWFFCCVENGRR